MPSVRSEIRSYTAWCRTGILCHTSVFLNISKELHNVGNSEINSWLLQYNVVLVMIYQAYSPDIWL